MGGAVAVNDSRETIVEQSGQFSSLTPTVEPSALIQKGKGNISAQSGAIALSNNNGTTVTQNYYQGYGGYSKEELLVLLKQRDEKISQQAKELSLISSSLDVARQNVGALKSDAERMQRNMPTAFKFSSQNASRSTPEMDILEFELTPVGDRMIPLFTVGAKSRSGKKIHGITISQSEGGYRTESRCNDGTCLKISYSNISPQNTTITVKTDKNADVFVGIDPFYN